MLPRLRSFGSGVGPRQRVEPPRVDRRLHLLERELKALEREIRELRQANETLRKASAYFCPGGARPPVQAMIAFIAITAKRMGSSPFAGLARQRISPNPKLPF